MNLLDEVKIENIIYEIRGKQVMLDSDLAKLYQCKNGTKTINLAVKRHINRFPERFMFQLTIEEYKSLRFQLETANNMTRSLPYVFTEQGVAMLATILKTNVAEEVSINIMDAFVAMKKYISSNLIEQSYINNLVIKHDEKIDLLEKVFNSFESSNNEIFFEGQIYDAYSKIIDIMEIAKEEVIIIDSYADKKVLDMICKIKVSIILITTNKLLKQIDINKYNEQYDNLTIIYNNSFHDRYLIIDKKIVYHCGTSLNYIGKKTFSVNKLEDKNVIELLINKIKVYF